MYIVFRKGATDNSSLPSREVCRRWMVSNLPSSSSRAMNLTTRPPPVSTVVLRITDSDADVTRIHPKRQMFKLRDSVQLSIFLQAMNQKNLPRSFISICGNIVLQVVPEKAHFFFSKTWRCWPSGKANENQNNNKSTQQTDTKYRVLGMRPRFCLHCLGASQLIYENA